MIPVRFLKEHECRKCKGTLSLIDINRKQISYTLLLSVGVFPDSIKDLLYFKCADCSDTVQIEWSNKTGEMLPYPMYDTITLDKFIAKWEE